MAGQMVPRYEKFVTYLGEGALQRSLSFRNMSLSVSTRVFILEKTKELGKTGRAYIHLKHDQRDAD